MKELPKIFLEAIFFLFKNKIFFIILRIIIG